MRAHIRRTTSFLLATGGAVLLAAGCATSSVGSASPVAVSSTSVASPPQVPGASATHGAGPSTLTPLEVRDFSLEPSDVTVSGDSVALRVSNAGPTIHNVTIRDTGGNVVVGTPDLREGESATLTTSLPPGTYVLFCSLPGHESLGIKGQLIVSP